MWTQEDRDRYPFSPGLGGRGRPPHSPALRTRGRPPYPPGPVAHPRRALWRPQDFNGPTWSSPRFRKPRYRWDDNDPESDSEDKTPSDSRESRKKTLLRVFSRFAERTSMQALPYIASSKTRLAKAVWALLLAVGVAVLSLHLKYLCDVYNSWPKQTRVALGFGKLPFPAVTVCNTNPLRISRILLATDQLRTLTTTLNPRRLPYGEVPARRRRATEVQGKGKGLGPPETPADTQGLPTRPNLDITQRGPAPHSNGVGPNRKKNDKGEGTDGGPTDQEVSITEPSSRGATDPPHNTDYQQTTADRQNSDNQQRTSSPQNMGSWQSIATQQNTVTQKTTATQQTTVTQNKPATQQNTANQQSTNSQQNTTTQQSNANEKRAQEQLSPEERTLLPILPPESLPVEGISSPTSGGDTPPPPPPPEGGESGSGVHTRVTNPVLTGAQTGTFIRPGVDFTLADSAGTVSPTELPGTTQAREVVDAPVETPPPAVTKTLLGEDIPTTKIMPSPEVEGEGVLEALPVTPTTSTVDNETLAYFSERLEMEKDPEISSVLPERSVMVDVVEEFNFLFNKEKRDTRVKMGHQIEDLLLTCSFAGRKCDPSNFALMVSPVFGNCFTIQHRDFVTSRPGPVQGLQLILFLENSEYVAGLTNSYGVQMVVHDPGSLPFPDMQGMAVSANMESNVALKLVQIERLGQPYGSCNNGKEFFRNTNTTYTRETCQQMCEQKQMVDNCGCVDDQQDLTLLRMAGFSSTRPCSTRDDARCLVKVKRSLRTGDSMCQCDNPCSERRYETGVTSRKWPTTAYTRVLLDLICGRGENYSNVCDELVETDQMQFGNNFLKLNVFYEDLNYENITEEPDYELVQFASDVGGTVGLWVGLSVLSIFELGQFLLELLYFLTLGCWQRRATPRPDPEKRDNSSRSNSDKGGKPGSGNYSQEMELNRRMRDKVHGDAYSAF